MSRDGDRPRPARRRYEPPKVVDLGALARITGDGETWRAACREGSGYIGSCWSGTNPTGVCKQGIGHG
jgi:hypothetical protein